MPLKLNSFLLITVIATAALVLFASGRSSTAAQAIPMTVQPTAAANFAIPTIFVIVMENHNWADISGKASAPYINNTLLPIAAHAEQYFNPPSLHPSEPNYLWLEAGTNFGITNDSGPKRNHQTSTAHLTTLLDSAGISWKSYQEGISGTKCPLVEEMTNDSVYAPKHNPMVFFDDVTGGNDPNSAYCIAHVRPYAELAVDLASTQPNAVAQYNFITPDLCDDMHDSGGCVTPDSVKNGDTWLSTEVPQILNSAAFKQDGLLFITWDESELGNNPIGLIALSQRVKAGYSNTLHYSHSSLLRTVEEAFNVSPLLGDAANALDLSDLFAPPSA